MNSPGLDFGTANSSLAVSNGTETDVLALDNGMSSIPSTFFYDFEDDVSYIGEEAYERYYMGDKGRFLRSFKSALGTSTLDHEIQIKRNRYKVKDIITQYIGKVLERAELALGQPIKNLVVGRPVHFVDHNPSADSSAEASLREIIHSLGVDNIEFMLEPIAAALNYGLEVTKEELVLVIDIGAGTSDFSVVKFGQTKPNDAQIVSNCGIHIGGNDVDKVVALNSAMPLFGYLERFKRREQLEVPNHYYLNASSWHKIDLLYDRKVINSLKEISPQVFNPALIERFLLLLNNRQIHNVLAEVERTKKIISGNASTHIDLSFVERELKVGLDKDTFHGLINDMCDGIVSSALEAVSLAGLQKENIDTVYVTGGSMGIKHLHNKVKASFEGAQLIDGDRSTAVSRGLALHANRIGF